MNPVHIKPAPTKTPPAVIGMGAGAALIILGAFLPWAVARVPLLGQITVNGMEGDGKLTALAATLALLVAAWRYKKPAAADRAAGALNFLIGLGVFFTGLYHIATIDDANTNEVAVTAGNGLYVTVAAAIILMASSGADIAQTLDRDR